MRFEFMVTYSFLKIFNVYSIGVLAGIILLTSCESDDNILGGDQNPDPVTLDFAIAYIKRPIPMMTDDDDNEVRVAEDLESPVSFNPGAVVMLRDRATTSAPERDITSQVFQRVDANSGDTIQDLYDVRDLAMNVEGTKMVFSMRGPFDPDEDEEDMMPKWNIWEYDLETETLRQIITSVSTAEAGHDIMPQYLADGRIIFSSTRQTRNKAILVDEGKDQFEAQTENFPNGTDAFLLHVMNEDGSNIRQITFNMSHDLYPTLLQNGRIAFVRWDRYRTDKNFNVYSVRPDGRDLQVLYGLDSHNPNGSVTDIEYFQPLIMSDNRLQMILKTRSNLRHGGDMVAIDIQNFYENTESINATSGVAQTTLALDAVATDEDQTSLGGLFHSATPLWDNSNRLLVSWSVCLLEDVPVATDPNDPTTIPPVQSFPCTDINLGNPALVQPEPNYALWMWDPTGTQIPVVIAENNTWITNPVVFQERPRPTVLVDEDGLDQSIVNDDVGVVHIRNVNDFDGTNIVNPNRPATFVRFVKGVHLPDEDVYDFDRVAFGRSAAQLMKDILGYAPVENDGSVKVEVPANVPFAVSVLDQNGRRIGARHENWIHVRPGEVLECHGCHIDANGVPHGRADARPASTNPSTMTQAEIEYDAGNNTQLSVDINFNGFSWLYESLGTQAPTTQGCIQSWSSTCRITFNYETHIQPLWELSRPRLDNMGNPVLDGMGNPIDDACVNCHSDAGIIAGVNTDLVLSPAPSADEPIHMVSYRELFFGDDEVTVINGMVVDRFVGVPAPNGDFIYSTSDGVNQFFFTFPTFQDPRLIADPGYIQNFVYTQTPTPFRTGADGLSGDYVYQVDIDDGSGGTTTVYFTFNTLIDPANYAAFFIMQPNSPANLEDNNGASIFQTDVNGVPLAGNQPIDLPATLVSATRNAQNVHVYQATETESSNTVYFTYSVELAATDFVLQRDGTTNLPNELTASDGTVMVQTDVNGTFLGGTIPLPAVPNTLSFTSLGANTNGIHVYQATDTSVIPNLTYYFTFTNEITIADGIFVLDHNAPTGLSDIASNPIFQTDMDGNPVSPAATIPFPITNLTPRLHDFPAELRVADSNGNPTATIVTQTDVNGNPLAGNPVIPLPVSQPLAQTQTVPINSPLNVIGAFNNRARFFNRFEIESNTDVHSSLLSPVELKLISEWLDIGAQYFNNPFQAPEN